MESSVEPAPAYLNRAEEGRSQIDGTGSKREDALR